MSSLGAPQMSEIYEKALELYQSGQSTTQIAKKLRRTPRTVRRILRGKLVRRQKIPCDTTQLMDFTSEIGQYWAGFLKARGYISKDRNRIRCAVQLKDIGHLYHLSRDLRSTLQPKRARSRAYLDINCGIMARIYREMSYLDTSHFWRGYVDGAGVITTGRGYLKIGVRDERMRVLLANFLQVAPQRFWYADAPRIGRMLYTGCIRYLPRKAKIILQFLARPDHTCITKNS